MSHEYKNSDALKRKLKQMRDKAQQDLKRLNVSVDVINHNQELFYTMATSLSRVTGTHSDVNPSDLLWLSLYHENLSYSRLPQEIKLTIGNLFKQFIELKEIDMSKKRVWASYSKLVDENPPLALFRTIDLAHFPMDYNMLVNSFMFKKETVEHQVRNIAESMLYVYAPFADILGIHNIHTSLREKSTKILYPKLYNEVNAKVMELKNENEYIQDEFGKRLEYDIIEAEMESNISFGSFKDGLTMRSRIKTTGSIVLKLLKKDLTVDDMMTFDDLVAFTVLTKTVEDAYKFVEFLMLKYQISRERLEDYIISPRGQTQYQSLHLSVPFVVEQFGEKKVRFIEVQIRTPEMQERCENGDLAHALYKQSKIDKERLLLMAKYATTLRNASTEEAQMLAFNLRPDRIFVKVMQSGIVKEVDLQENSCIFDLICKVSDPFFVHKVISLSTGRSYSIYELVNPNYEYFIEKTNEKTSPATINNILTRCSLETRMNLEYELNKRK